MVNCFFFIIFSSFGALLQTNIKKFLAYSAITNSDLFY